MYVRFILLISIAVVMASPSTPRDEVLRALINSPPKAKKLNKAVHSPKTSLAAASPDAIPSPEAAVETESAANMNLLGGFIHGIARDVMNQLKPESLSQAPSSKPSSTNTFGTGFSTNTDINRQPITGSRVSGVLNEFREKLASSNPSGSDVFGTVSSTNTDINKQPTSGSRVPDFPNVFRKKVAPSNPSGTDATSASTNTGINWPPSSGSRVPNFMNVYSKTATPSNPSGTGIFGPGSSTNTGINRQPTSGSRIPGFLSIIGNVFHGGNSKSRIYPTMIFALM